MTTRIMPVQDRYEFMRHQVLEPFFKSVSLSGVRPFDVPCFRLVGFGATEDKALKRAMRDKRYKEWLVKK